MVLKGRGFGAKVASVLLTVSLIGLLILAGPAEAFSLNLSPENSMVDLGEEVSFVASLDIEPGERLPVDYLELKAGNAVTCRFEPDGSAIFGCEGLNIDRISDANFTGGDRLGNFSGTEYNFGYGYGYGFPEGLAYNISLNSSILGGGVFVTKLRAKMAGEATVFESDEGSLTINVPEDMTIYSPEERVYDSRRLQINLTTSFESELIEVMNLDDRNPRFRRLCANCEEYGFERRRTINVNEGENLMVFRAHGSLIEKNVSFIVDTRNPMIRRTEPRRGFTNGLFVVEFREENPTLMFLNYGNEGNIKTEEVNLSTCYEDRRDRVCNATVDLSEFEGEEIRYWFYMEDILGNTAESRDIRVGADTLPPVIHSFNYSIERRRVEFSFNVSEENLDEINYIDNLDKRPRERRICTTLRDGTCGRRVSFRRGDHSVDIFAYDDAGNSVVVASGLNFTIV